MSRPVEKWSDSKDDVFEAAMQMAASDGDIEWKRRVPREWRVTEFWSPAEARLAR
jgi:hypothetical protein